MFSSPQKNHLTGKNKNQLDRFFTLINVFRVFLFNTYKRKKLCFYFIFWLFWRAYPVWFLEGIKPKLNYLKTIFNNSFILHTFRLFKQLTINRRLGWSNVVVTITNIWRFFILFYNVQAYIRINGFFTFLIIVGLRLAIKSSEKRLFNFF